jgi:hypothetical protein
MEVHGIEVELGRAAADASADASEPRLDIE